MKEEEKVGERDGKMRGRGGKLGKSRDGEEEEWGGGGMGRRTEKRRDGKKKGRGGKQRKRRDGEQEGSRRRVGERKDGEGKDWEGR